MSSIREPQPITARSSIRSQRVADRRGHRWVGTLEPVRIDPADEPSPARLRTRGVYLITGGFGGIGLTLAEYLARSVSARLVLIGRRALPPRAEWPAHVARHGE